MAVHSWTDGHVPICALVLSRAIFLIFWLIIHIYSSYRIVMLVYLYTYSIPICILLFKLYSYIPSSLSCQHLSPHLINTF